VVVIIRNVRICVSRIDVCNREQIFAQRRSRKAVLHYNITISEYEKRLLSSSNKNKKSEELTYSNHCYYQKSGSFSPFKNKRIDNQTDINR
jgi:hypothetical protein